MGLLYLLVGLACGVAVGVGIKKRGISVLDETIVTAPDEKDASKPPEHPRFPDIEYDVEPEEP